ncbi:MAG: PASTA domain-containing protein [Acidobacteriota bacterium]
MSIFQRGLSAIGKLAALAILLAVFMAGMVTVVVMSMQGSEIKVPEITGKNFTESEHELAALGLKIKKRADRVSQDPPNTIIEQLPKPGETVKSGQMILVVTSKAAVAGDDQAPVIKKTEEDDSSKIEEMISDKPKKPKANANTNKKKADTTRDVIGDNSNSDSNSTSNSSESNSNKKESGSNNNSSTNSKSSNSNKSNPNPGPRNPAGNTTRPGEGRPRLSNRQ